MIRALGGFDLRPVAGVAVASPGGVPGNASLLWQAIVLLFGANQPGIPHQPQMISAHVLVQGMSAFHVIGLLVAAAGLAAGIASLRYRHADRGTQVIVAAILVLLAFGLFSTLLRSRSYIHEIAVLLPLSAALAGRVLVPLVRRRLPKRPRVAPPSRLAFLILGGWLALSVAEVCYTATWPALQPSQQAVAAWLVAHHEHTGLAGYWQAGSTTVTTGGRVLVAAITLNQAANSGQAEAGEPAAYRWETSADWYSPARHDATFVIAVADPAAGGGQAGLAPAAIRARFGPAAAEHRVGRDVIMLYRYNLLARLAATTFPGQ